MTQFLCATLSRQLQCRVFPEDFLSEGDPVVFTPGV
jgi:hypothetical protein